MRLTLLSMRKLEILNILFKPIWEKYQLHGNIYSPDVHVQTVLLLGMPDIAPKLKEEFSEYFWMMHPDLLQVTLCFSNIFDSMHS